MSTGALFGSSTSRSQNKNLVEFRAGKMFLRGNMVHPDKRKGLLYVYQSEDSLVHLCWKDRTSGSTEDDFIIFPDDVEYKHVPQCTTGRVYLLKFNSDNRKLFFWMQEPKPDKDDEYCRKMNEYFNNPPTPGSSRGIGGSLPAGLAETDLQNLLGMSLGNMDQQQLAQLLGGIGGGSGLSLLGGRSTSSQSDSTPPSRVQSSPGSRSTAGGEASSRPVTSTVPPSTNTTNPPIQLTDLQTILTSFSASGSGSEMDLSLGLTSESVSPILNNDDALQRLAPLLPQTGSSTSGSEELRQTVSSAQFQQALQGFSSGLSSGQLGPLLRHFDLSDEAISSANRGNVSEFAKALQSASEKKKADDDKTKTDADKTDDDQTRDDKTRDDKKPE